MGAKVGRAVALVAIAVFVGGCSATLTLRDGRQVRGEIVSSDADAVSIEQEGAVKRVHRKDIADVTHPGTGMVVLGASAIVLGGGMMALADWNGPPSGACGEGPGQSESYCEQQADIGLIAAGVGSLVVGMVAVGAGVAAYQESRFRYNSLYTRPGRAGRPIASDSTVHGDPAARPMP